LQNSKVVASMKPSVLIEDFNGDWQKEWFSYNVQKWGIKTHKLYHPAWKAPENSYLYLEVKAEEANKLIIGLDGYFAEVSLTGKNKWQGIKLQPQDFYDFAMKSRKDWKDIKELRLDDAETLRPPKGSELKVRKIGGRWTGNPPEFRFLRWL